MSARAGTITQHWRATVSRSKKNIPPESGRRFSGRSVSKTISANSKFCRATSEPYLFRWRHVAAEVPRAGTLQVCARHDAGGVRDAGRSYQESQQLSPWSDRANSRETRDFALDRMCATTGSISHEQCVVCPAPKRSHIGSRQNAQGQTYAVDYIRQQVIAAVRWDRAINEGYRIHTTIDVNLQRAAEDSLKAHLEQAETTSGLQSSHLRRLRSIVS